MSGARVIELHGSGRETIAELLRKAGVEFAQPCGGRASCGKCRVRAYGELDEVSQEERAALTNKELAAGLRLACCARVRGAVHLYLDEAGTGAKIVTAGTMQQTQLHPLHKRLGAAVDIGTTTLAAQLLEGDSILASAAMLNPQRSYGADVITRLGSALSGHADALAQCIRHAIASLLEEICAQAGRETQEIDALVITGNTAMLYLLTQRDVTPLSYAPFVIDEHFGYAIPASSLNLPCAMDAQLYLPRCISAFVGADITTALLASGICEGGQTALLADIGTNGEIALWHAGHLICCSTAAGPAFEGASLTCGMQGELGAIDHVWLEDGKLQYHVIGEARAKGICGSGVADLLACLLRMEIIDETGYFANGEEAYTISEGVCLTQRDVRQIQLAKSAICAGMRTLVEHAGLEIDDIQTLSIAGGFGSYLSSDSAAAIGLIPKELQNRCKILGNAALAGAVMLEKDASLHARSYELASQSSTLELATSEVFMNYYIEGMQFEA